MERFSPLQGKMRRAHIMQRQPEGIERRQLAERIDRGKKVREDQRRNRKERKRVNMGKRKKESKSERAIERVSRNSEREKQGDRKILK